MVAKLIALVLPLGLDTFAVCCALGLAGIPAARRGRISLIMVVFEAGMPLVGVAIGAPLGHAIGGDAAYLAIGVLALFGGYTLLTDEDEERAGGLLDASGWALLALGLSVSLDELAVGFALGLLRLPVGIVIAAIAAQTVAVSQLGLGFGARLGERARERAEQLAGLTLVGLAAVLLAERLLA